MADDRPGILLPPPVYPALALLAAWGLERVAPLPGVPLWASALGALPLGAGLGLILWAALTFRRHRTPVDPYRPAAELAADGPYAWSRNPIYLGFLLAQAGLGLLLEWLWALALLPAAAAALWAFVVRKEEAHLERRFGDRYRAYRSRVRRWLGRL